MTRNREKGIRGVIALILIGIAAWVFGPLPYGILYVIVWGAILSASGFNVASIPKLWEKTEEDDD